MPDCISSAMKRQISECLFSQGAREVFLFGSHFNGTAAESSDIDIGVKGLPPDRILKSVSMLERIAERDVDLVDFDYSTDFFEHLCRTKKITCIGRRS